MSDGAFLPEWSRANAGKDGMGSAQPPTRAGGYVIDAEG